MGLMASLIMSMGFAQQETQLDWSVLKIDSVLPTYTEVIPLGEDYQAYDYQVVLEYPEYVSVSEEELNWLKNKRTVLPSVPEINTYIGVSRKQGFLDLAFIPVVFQDGQYKKLVSCRIKLQGTPRLPQTVKTLTCFGVLSVVASQTAQALQYWDYTLADGSPFVTLEVYDEGDDFVFNNYPDDDGSPLQGESGWTLSDDDKTRIDESFDYLGRMIGKFVVSTGSIAVVTDSDKDGNAAATSNIITTGPLAGITELTAELLYGVKGDDKTGLIFINHTTAEDGNWYYGPM